jgi:hypothetical protein
LFTAFIFLQLIGFTLELPLLVLSSTDYIDPTGRAIANLVTYPFYLSILCLHLSIMLPDFRLQYSSIVILLFTVIFDSLFPVLAANWRGDGAVISGEILRFQTTPIFDLYFLFMVLLTVGLISGRYRSMKRALDMHKNPVPPPRYLIIIPVLMVGSMILTGIIEVSRIPGESDNLPIATVFFIFAYSYRKGNHFLHIIPVKIFGVIIVERNSGVVFFSKGETEDDATEVLLGGLLTALNISLQEAIQTDQDLEELNFSDKVVHIAPHDDVIALLITSQKSLMTQTIAKFLSRAFARQFHDIIANPSLRYDTSHYAEFEQTYLSIARYFIT